MRQNLRLSVMGSVSPRTPGSGPRQRSQWPSPIPGRRCRARCRGRSSTGAGTRAVMGPAGVTGMSGAWTVEEQPVSAGEAQREDVAPGVRKRSKISAVDHVTPGRSPGADRARHRDPALWWRAGRVRRRRRRHRRAARAQPRRARRPWDQRRRDLGRDRRSGAHRARRPADRDVAGGLSRTPPR